MIEHHLQINSQENKNWKSKEKNIKLLSASPSGLLKNIKFTITFQFFTILKRDLVYLKQMTIMLIFYCCYFGFGESQNIIKCYIYSTVLKTFDCKHQLLCTFPKHIKDSLEILNHYLMKELH